MLRTALMELCNGGCRNRKALRTKMICSKYSITWLLKKQYPGQFFLMETSSIPARKMMQKRNNEKDLNILT